MASPNAPGQNALAGIMADIGIEQIASSSLQCPDLSNTREWPYDTLSTAWSMGSLMTFTPAQMKRYSPH